MGKLRPMEPEPERKAAVVNVREAYHDRGEKVRAGVGLGQNRKSAGKPEISRLEGF